MKNALDVSIIVPAYEAADFIGTAIKSCLAQVDIKFEVIVVDDGSIVSSAKAVADAANGDPRVHFIQMPKNMGPSVARNVAMQQARGRYIAVLDADDEMASNRLSVMVSAADTTGMDIIVDQMISVDFEQADVGTETFLNDFGPDPIEISLLDYVDPDSDERFGKSLGYLKPLFRTQFIREFAVQYSPALRNSEDYYFVVNLLANGATMLLLPYTGYIYKIRVGSLSYRLCPKKAFAIVRAEMRFQEIYANYISGEVRLASEIRLDRAKKIAEFELLAAGLKDKSTSTVLRGLLSTPRHTPSHITELFSVFRKKVEVSIFRQQAA